MDEGGMSKRKIHFESYGLKQQRVLFLSYSTRCRLTFNYLFFTLPSIILLSPTLMAIRFGLTSSALGRRNVITPF